MEKRDLIQEQTILALKKFALKTDIHATTALKELRLKDLDDQWAIRLLEKVTGANPPKAAWENLQTVNDVIDLLCSYSPLPQNFSYSEEIEETNKIISTIWPSWVPGVAAIILGVVFLFCVMMPYLKGGWLYLTGWVR